METYAVSEMVKDIKVILDRNQESSDLIPDDTDTLSQGELIRSRIEDAARLVLSGAPPQMIDADGLRQKPTWQYSNGAYVGKVKLQPSVMRILSVRASDWNRPGKLITEHDGEYRMQTCRFGVRGNPERPVAALVHTGGGRYIELYTSGTSNATADISYVKSPSIVNGQIILPPLLLEAVKYMAASLVCTSLGDSGTASGLASVAKGLAGMPEAETTQTE